MDYGVARRKDHWSVSPTNGLSTKAPQRSQSLPLCIMRGRRRAAEREASGCPSVLYLLTLTESPALWTPQSRGQATGIHAGERKPLGSYRRGRVCWRKESSDLSVEAQGQHSYFYFSHFMYAFTIVFGWTQVPC